MKKSKILEFYFIKKKKNIINTNIIFLSLFILNIINFIVKFYNRILFYINIL